MTVVPLSVRAKSLFKIHSFLEFVGRVRAASKEYEDVLVDRE